MNNGEFQTQRNEKNEELMGSLKLLPGVPIIRSSLSSLYSFFTWIQSVSSSVQQIKLRGCGSSQNHNSLSHTESLLPNQNLSLQE